MTLDVPVAQVKQSDPVKKQPMNDLMQGIQKKMILNHPQNVMEITSGASRIAFLIFVFILLRFL
jgi:hypothetical protein